MTNTTTIPTLAGDGNFTAYRAVPASTLKAAVDPHGILAPGKQGIWPR